MVEVAELNVALAGLAFLATYCFGGLAAVGVLRQQVEAGFQANVAHVKEFVVEGANDKDYPHVQHLLAGFVWAFTETGLLWYPAVEGGHDLAKTFTFPPSTYARLDPLFKPPSSIEVKLADKERRRIQRSNDLSLMGENQPESGSPEMHAWLAVISGFRALANLRSARRLDLTMLLLGATAAVTGLVGVAFALVVLQ